jgi:hypothetical protein
VPWFMMYTEPLRCMKQFMADCRPTRPRSLVPLSRPGGYALRSANSQKPEPLSSPRQALADQTVRDFRSTRRAEANVRYLRILFSNGSRLETLLGVDALGMPAFSPRSFGA